MCLPQRRQDRADTQKGNASAERCRGALFFNARVGIARTCRKLKVSLIPLTFDYTLTASFDGCPEARRKTRERRTGHIARERGVKKRPRVPQTGESASFESGSRPEARLPDRSRQHRLPFRRCRNVRVNPTSTSLYQRCSDNAACVFWGRAVDRSPLGLRETCGRPVRASFSLAY